MDPLITTATRGLRSFGRKRAARRACIPALTAEVESAAAVLNAPAARLIARGKERVLLLEDVEALLASKLTGDAGAQCLLVPP